jgi:hypothetical protein
MTEDQVKQLIRLCNIHMQRSYSSALGSSTRAYDISDKLDLGFAYAIRASLKDMGMLSKEGK